MIKKHIYEGEEGYDKIKCKPITEFGTGELYKLLALSNGLIDLAESARLTNIVHSVIPKICGTCQYWNFKSSDGEQNCFGQCRSPEFNRSHYIIADFPDTMKTPDEYRRFAKNIRDNADMRVNENFGCIYHERKE